ncbi:hypothetical protein D3C86_2195680 [compost metagenome]
MDAILLSACSRDWQPLPRVMADVMAGTDGFFAFWRARELAAQGRVELSGHEGQHGYGGLSVRLS